MWIQALMWIAVTRRPTTNAGATDAERTAFAREGWSPHHNQKRCLTRRESVWRKKPSTPDERGDEQEAIDLWKESYATVPKVELLFNLGLVYWRQTSFIEAAEAYNQFLETAPESHPLYEEAKHNLMECQRDYMRAGKLSARAGAGVLPSAPALEMPLAVEKRITEIRKEERARALWITGASSAAVVGVVTGFFLTSSGCPRPTLTLTRSSANREREPFMRYFALALWWLCLGCEPERFPLTLHLTGLTENEGPVLSSFIVRGGPVGEEPKEERFDSGFSLPTDLTLNVPANLRTETLEIEVIGVVGEIEVFRTAVFLAPGQTEAALIISPCSDHFTAEPEECDDGNLT